VILEPDKVKWFSFHLRRRHRYRFRLCSIIRTWQVWLISRIIGAWSFVPWENLESSFQKKISMVPLYLAMKENLLHPNWTPVLVYFSTVALILEMKSEQMTYREEQQKGTQECNRFISTDRLREFRLIGSVVGCLVIWETEKVVEQKRWLRWRLQSSVKMLKRSCAH